MFEKEFEKRVNVKLINNENDYLVVVHNIKPVLLLNKPIYVGFYVLELSKLVMYDWHYNYFAKKFNCSLFFTDTDSLVYEIKDVDDVYEKIYEDKELFDFSDYSKESKYYDESNKKVVLKMKDEMHGKVISEFVCLKSKMYSLIKVDNEENNKSTRN